MVGIRTSTKSITYALPFHADVTEIVGGKERILATCTTGPTGTLGPMFRGRSSRFGEIWRPEKLEEVLPLFSQGVSIDEVAVCLGISRPTLYNWLSDPDKGEILEVNANRRPADKSLLGSPGPQWAYTEGL